MNMQINLDLGLFHATMKDAQVWIQPMMVSPEAGGFVANISHTSSTGGIEIKWSSIAGVRKTRVAH
jgi:hypothetical protein